MISRRSTGNKMFYLSILILIHALVWHHLALAESHQYATKDTDEPQLELDELRISSQRFGSVAPQPASGAFEQPNPMTNRPRDDLMAPQIGTVSQSNYLAQRGQGLGVRLRNMRPQVQQLWPLTHRMCRVLSLAEIQMVTMEDNELIIKDSLEQPNYILTMRAFIKWTQDDYFPLNNLKPLPSGSRIISLEKPATLLRDGATLNCSSASNMSPIVNPKPAPANGFHTNQSRPAAAFSINNREGSFPSKMTIEEERILLQLDCGYLLISMQNDGLQLKMKTISFHHQKAAKTNQQPPPPPTTTTTTSSTVEPFGPTFGPPTLSGSQLPVSKPPAERRSRQRAAPVGGLEMESVVFGSKGGKDLLTMPLMSRYVCRDRIVLEARGKGSAKLVLDRFELMRLIPSTVKQHDDRMLVYRRLSDHKAANRLTRLTNLMVTSCPKQRNPQEPLSSMLDDGQLDPILSDLAADRLMSRVEGQRSSNGAVGCNRCNQILVASCLWLSIVVSFGTINRRIKSVA